jgi:transcriptional regulator with XRE-family HTH domain
LRELGTRIRAVRTARRLGLPAVARVTGIPYQQLLDAERGTAILSVLGVYRVAEALEVLPAELLTDVEPLELLRRLAARMRAEESSSDQP